MIRDAERSRSSTDIVHGQLIDLLHPVRTDPCRNPEAHGIQPVPFLEQPVLLLEDGDHGLNLRFSRDNGPEHVAGRPRRARGGALSGLIDEVCPALFRLLDDLPDLRGVGPGGSHEVVQGDAADREEAGARHHGIPVLAEDDPLHVFSGKPEKAGDGVADPAGVQVPGLAHDVFPGEPGRLVADPRDGGHGVAHVDENRQVAGRASFVESADLERGPGDHLCVDRKEVPSALSLPSRHADADEDDVQACHVFRLVGPQDPGPPDRVRLQVFDPRRGPVGVTVLGPAIEHDLLTKTLIDEGENDVPGHIPEPPDADLVPFPDPFDETAFG